MICLGPLLPGSDLYGRLAVICVCEAGSDLCGKLAVIYMGGYYQIQMESGGLYGRVAASGVPVRFSGVICTGGLLRRHTEMCWRVGQWFVWKTLLSLLLIDSRSPHTNQLTLSIQLAGCPAIYARGGQGRGSSSCLCQSFRRHLIDSLACSILWC